MVIPDPPQVCFLSLLAIQARESSVAGGKLVFFNDDFWEIVYVLAFGRSLWASKFR